MQGRPGKELEQAQVAIGLERTEGQEQILVEAGGGQAEARKAVTESALLSTGCAAPPDQALPGTLAASPFLSAARKLQELPYRDKKAAWGRCFQGEGENRYSELLEMIFLGHLTP